MRAMYLMECGHASNSVCNGEPCCAICTCLTVSKKIEHSTEGLEGRECKCNSCGKITKSEWDLPFFEYKPESEYDSAYDGCFGWN